MMPRQLTLLPSGRQLNIHDNESILAAALRQGVMLPYGCQSGTCGKCKGQIVQGLVMHSRPTLALSVAEQEQGMALLCCSQPQTDVVLVARERAPARNVEARTFSARVARIDKHRAHVMILSLELPAAQSFSFLPGQFIQILLPSGERCRYPLANAPDSPCLELHIHHDAEDQGGQWLWAHLQEQALLRIHGPLGPRQALMLESQSPLLIFVDRQGFAPAQSILESLWASASQREVRLCWLADTPEDFYQAALLREWKDAHPHFHDHALLASVASGAPSSLGAQLEALVSGWGAMLADAMVYVSGSSQLEREVRCVFAHHGLASEQFFSAT